MRSAFAAFLFCAATLAGAQQFPTKPLHLIVPFPPGGGNDTVARAIAQQLGPAMYETMAGVRMVHVPYKGIAPAMTDLMSGEVQLMFGTVVALVPHIQAGKLRALAVTSRKRSALLPDLPTIAESGLPDYE